MERFLRVSASGFAEKSDDIAVLASECRVTVDDFDIDGMSQGSSLVVCCTHEGVVVDLVDENGEVVGGSCQTYEEIAESLLASDVTVVNREQALEAALREFIKTVEATGGVNLECEPNADPEWLDLGHAYVAACDALGIGIVYSERSDDPQEEESDETE